MLSSIWEYSASGPAPPSPALIITTPDYSPPRSPFTPYATTIDDCTPCPPSPYCVPPCEDEVEALDAADSEATKLTPSGQPDDSESELSDSTTPMGFPMDETMHDYYDQIRDDDQPHVSDYLIYYPEIYARPSPILMIMQRATLDKHGYQGFHINPLTCNKSFKLFSFTGGHVPMTGLRGHDEQTLQYYAKRPFPHEVRRIGDLLLYRYSINVIKTVRYSLHTNWPLVYPSPIPVLLIRSHDLIGPQSLSRRLDGFAFVVPTENSFWPIVLQRGVDANFRPLDPTVTIETDICFKGAAAYWPQHIVAPKLAVNVFLECTSYATGQYPRCEYLGAYVMRLVENLTMHSDTWATIDPEVQQSAHHRILYHVDGRPHLPLVQFLYYKWDENILGLADEILQARVLALIKCTTGSSDELGHGE